MVNQELFDYIKKQLDNKIPEDAVRKALLDVGWQSAMVEEAFGAVKASATSAPPPPAAIPVVKPAAGLSTEITDRTQSAIQQTASTESPTPMTVAPQGAVLPDIAQTTGPQIPPSAAASGAGCRHKRVRVRRRTSVCPHQ